MLVSRYLGFDASGLSGMSGSAVLWWKLAILNKDVELRPVAKPVLTQAWPKFGLSFLRSVVNKDGHVTAQESELFTGSPAQRSHIGENGDGAMGAKF